MIRKKMILLVALWSVCYGGRAVAEPQVETEYLAILLEGKKIGHAVHARTIDGAKVTTCEQLTMTLGRGGQAVKIDSTESHFETLDGKPLGFEMLLNMSGVEQKHIGVVADGKVAIVTEAMGQKH